MSAATPAASRLLCRSLAANSARTSSRRAVNAASQRSAVATACTATSPPCYNQQQRQQFHSSSALEGRRKRSPFRNIKAEDMGLLDDPKLKERIAPEYSAADLQALRGRYTPEQLAAIRLGERAVSAEDLVEQGRLRSDPYQMPYTDDFSVVRPHVDKRQRPELQPGDTSGRFMTPDEFADDFIEWVRELDAKDGVTRDVYDINDSWAMYEEMRSKMLNKADGEQLTKRDLAEALDRVIGASGMPEGSEKEDEEVDPLEAGEEGGESSEDGKPSLGDMEIYKYLTERNAMTGFGGTPNDTALAPDLPKQIPGVAGLYKQNMEDEDAALDPEGAYQDLKRQTGLSIKELTRAYTYDTRVLVTRFVSNQTRLGKIRSSYILAISGDRNGRLGLGEAKSVESSIATQKAMMLAIKNMQPIRRYENRTIYGDVSGKVGATVVNLCARPPGFGLRVPHRIFEMARAAGIEDLASKMTRSRNPMNSVKACFKALTNQPDPEQIAIGRGKKLVDARKVYYGGAVY